MLKAPYFEDDSTARVAEGRLIVSEAFRNTSDRVKSFTVDELHALVFRFERSGDGGTAGRSSRGVAGWDDRGVEGPRRCREIVPKVRILCAPAAATSTARFT
jgi:hypothetical protein